MNRISLLGLVLNKSVENTKVYGFGTMWDEQGNRTISDTT